MPYSDTGSVHVYDMQDPLHSSLVWTSNAHQGAEGFALAWSPMNKGLLATGDTRGGLFVHKFEAKGERGEGGGVVLEDSPYVTLDGHEASVECLAWYVCVCVHAYIHTYIHAYIRIM